MKTYKTVLIMLLVTITFFSCSTSSDEDTNPIAEIPEPVPEPIPILTSFSPTGGPKTTLVTIIGNNFAATSDIQVFFNDVEAVINSSTATEIVTTVPTTLTGTVTVISNGTKLVGETFTYVTTTEVSTFAGQSLSGTADGEGTNSQFNNPRGIVIDDEGNFYVADGNNHSVRKITPDGTVSTIVGGSQGTNALFDLSYGIGIDSKKNLFVTSPLNRSVIKITPDAEASLFAGGALGNDDGTGEEAEFAFPTGMIIDALDNLILVDDSRIRKISPNAEVNTFVGSSPDFEDGAEPKFNQPRGIAIDAQNNLYIADSQNNRIRKVAPDGQTTTLSGSTSGFQDGDVAEAKFNSPRGITLDQEGNIYVADSNNNRIRKITPSGIVSTIAGSTVGFADGNAETSKFDHPNSIAIDNDGNLYVTDQNNHRIRKITQD